jgi:PAS domain S-box-containing protein
MPKAMRDNLLQQTEQALRESEKRLQNILSSIDEVVWSASLDGRQIHYINSAVEQIWGLPVADFYANAWPLTEVIHPEDRARVAQSFHVFIAGGDFDTEYRIVRPDGETRWIHDRGRRVAGENGQRVALTGIAADVTKHKHSEERLREQDALLDQTQEAIIVNDLAGRILFWNRGAASLYGWRAEEVIGRSLAGQAYRDEASHTAAAQALFGQGIWKGELRQYTKDGREIIVEGHWTLINDDEGKPKSVLIVNHDTTEKKKIASQFLRAQRLESIGTLASGIAHDLNNVLTPIMMALQILQMRFTDENSQRMLEVLRQSAERGGEMVKQVLSFTRGIEGQKIALQPTCLIKEILKVLRETLPRNITVKQLLPPDIGAINGDATQLHQVLMNLCVNARDAMPDGGALTIEAANTVIDEHYAAMVPDASAGRYVMITVSDTGEGIPEHIKDKIFDPFFTTKETGKGTGLGLSTVIGIVKSMSGFINVYSEAGKGARFKIYLPLLDTARAAETAATQTALPRGNGELILVVDDEAGIRDIAKTTLETFGYRVLTADDGTAAVALYASHLGEVQVVLTDMMMPFLDGAATIRALQKLDPQVRIIASTGLSEGMRSEDAEKLGARLVLSKPYTAETLLKALAASLHQEAVGAAGGGVRASLAG